MNKASRIAIIVVLPLLISAAPAAAKGNAAKGKETFVKFCSGCHGNTGKGDGPAGAALNPKPKDLTDSAYVSKLDDKYLQNVISKGGAAMGKSPLMPSWSNSLKGEDIQNLIAYIRTLSK